MRPGGSKRNKSTKVMLEEKSCSISYETQREFEMKLFVKVNSAEVALFIDLANLSS